MKRWNSARSRRIAYVVKWVVGAFVVLAAAVYTGWFGWGVRTVAVVAVYGAAGFYAAGATTPRRALLQVAALLAPWLIVYGGALLVFAQTIPNYPSIATGVLGGVIGAALRMGVERPLVRVGLALVAFAVVGAAGLAAMPTLVTLSSQWEGNGGFVDEPPLDLTLRTADGTVVRLDELDASAVALSFWTSACGVCLRKMPALNEYYTSRPDDVAVYSVHVSTGPGSVRFAREYVAAHEYAFPVLFAEGEYREVAPAVRLPWVPWWVVLDGDAHVRYRGHVTLEPWYLRLYRIDHVLDTVRRRAALQQATLQQAAPKAAPQRASAQAADAQAGDAQVADAQTPRPFGALSANRANPGREGETEIETP